MDETIERHVQELELQVIDPPLVRQAVVEHADDEDAHQDVLGGLLDLLPDGLLGLPFGSLRDQGGNLARQHQEGIERRVVRRSSMYAWWDGYALTSRSHCTASWVTSRWPSTLSSRRVSTVTRPSSSFRRVGRRGQRRTPRAHR